ncbi:lyase family protein [Miltoncostaea marina]|uniref:lyase family protein n=1 Tax=Miltoncostaea marina TaxID=2843215 RepID=UPI001C3D6CCC|nr:lyase family protein [Miltoncostaea marina]
MTDDYLGAGGRLRGGPAPELVRAGYAHEAGHGPRLARWLSLADLAHAVALVEAGAVAGDDARGLLRGLLELDGIPGGAFPWRPELGDAFNSREHELKARVGASAAGWLSAGRPRREAFRVALRLAAREGALDLHDASLDLAAALVGLAERHAADLAADYTYLQPAQPTTVGHLLLAHAYPALRDAGRLRGAHAWLDRSVAGVGGSAGSRWPIDRERLADLLGCAGVMRHAKDAMWQADGYVELVAAVATAATHASQLGQDLEILASQEFAAVSLADRHSRASALMPQKRNPYALAVIRTQAGIAAGDLAAILVALHTGSARTDHFHLLNGSVPRLLEEAGAVTALAAEVVAGLTIDPARWERAAREGFTAAADVADVLAVEAGIDYRTAHHVVGRAVRDLVDAGLPPDALTPERLAAAAEASAGRAVTISAEALAGALDPAACVAARLQTGSAAPGEVAAMIAECRAAVAEARGLSAAARERAAGAARGLRERARELAG